MTPISQPSRLICVGVIGPPHGVKGLLRIQPFTETPDALVDYAPFVTEDGSALPEVDFRSLAKGKWLAALDGIGTREAADALRGTRLFVPRDRLPPTEDEDFYHSDLIGLDVEDTDGQALGRILAVHDFGAGDLLEIGRGKGDSVLLPFTRETVPDVDIDAGKVIIVMPPGLIDDGTEAPE